VKLLVPSVFLVLSISFVATQTPAAPDDVLAKEHAAMDRDHPDEVIALLQQLATAVSRLKAWRRSLERNGVLGSGPEEWRGFAFRGSIENQPEHRFVLVGLDDLDDGAAQLAAGVDALSERDIIDDEATELVEHFEEALHRSCNRVRS
jgi:X-X-X-Leu-X-X-Gly heptad repeat protein